MTKTAALLRENLSRFCPITNLYECSDGTYLLVTVNHLDAVGTLLGIAERDGWADELGISGTSIMAAQVHSQPTEVFAADVTRQPVYEWRPKAGVDDPQTVDDIEQVLVDEILTIDIVDADGDPINGMTPVARLDAGTSFMDALASLGYTLTEGE